MSESLLAPRGLAPSEHAPGDLDQEIASLETRLGIITPEERLCEATLFIDYKFIMAACLTGRVSDIERLFGDQAWHNHLAARIKTQEYGDQPLTLDFITDIHQTFLEGVVDEPTPSVLTSTAARGGAIHNGAYVPIFTYTREQIDAINDNPYLTWQEAPDFPRQPAGYIGYTVLGAEKRTEELQKICHEYNDVWQPLGGRLPRGEAALKAGRLLQNLVALHAFSVDCNGRTARTIANWASVRDGGTPLTYTDFDKDLLLSEKDFRLESIRATNRYASIQTRMSFRMEGPDILPEFEDLLAELTRRGITLTKLAQHVPPFNERGEWQEHYMYDIIFNAISELIYNVGDAHYNWTSKRKPGPDINDSVNPK